MIIISRTPVRISFFGGGTDYPDYFKRHKGAVLGTTINKYTYISINTLSAFFDHKMRIGYSKTELINTIEEIEHPSIRECLRFVQGFQNLDIHIFSDLPAKTGLGSSSSFTVGFLNGMYVLQGKKVSKQRLGEEACYIEQKMIEENVGSQDQFHAAYGGINIIEFSDESVHVKPLIIPREKRLFLQDHLLIFYTGLTRYASKILEEQIKKTANLSNDDYLKRMHEMVYEAEKIISESEEEEMIQDLGHLLDESWKLKKRLSSKISNPLIDQAYHDAMKNGAYGGKICGAGGGGFLAFLVPENKKDGVRNALKNFMEVDFRFENEGSSIIYMKD